MADNGETNWTLIITGFLAALGIGSTAAYVGYKFGQGDGHKEGYADGISDCKEKFDSLKECNEDLMRKYEDLLVKHGKLKEDVGPLLEYARDNLHIQANSPNDVENAKREIGKKIDQEKSLLVALSGNESSDCCKGRLRDELEDWQMFKFFDKGKNAYVEKCRFDLPGEKGLGDAIYVDFGDGVIARLDVPDFSEEYPSINNIPAVSRRLYKLAGSRLIANDLATKLIKDLRYSEIPCGAIKFTEVEAKNYSFLGEELYGNPVYEIMSVRSKWLEATINEKLDAVWRDAVIAKAEDEKDVEKDREFFEANDSIWIRISHLSEKTRLRSRWCKTPASRFWYYQSGSDYQIEQDELSVYDICLVDKSKNKFSMAATAIDDLAGLYKCKIVEIDHRRGVVLAYSEPLVEYHNRISRTQTIKRLESEVWQREEEMPDDRYNSRQLDALYQRLSRLTGGGYDLKRS